MTIRKECSREEVDAPRRRWPAEGKPGGDTLCVDLFVRGCLLSFAARIGASRLLLTHFSQRYRGDAALRSVLTMERVEDEARYLPYCSSCSWTTLLTSYILTLSYLGVSTCAYVAAQTCIRDRTTIAASLCSCPSIGSHCRVGRPFGGAASPRTSFCCSD